MPKPITYRTDIPGYLIETPLGLINTQPTQIPFEPIREKLREAIEKYKENHPEKTETYKEFRTLFDALEHGEIFDTKNIDEMFCKQYRKCYGKPYDRVTWLQLAVLLESKELVQDMLQYGASVNIQNTKHSKEAALHFAAETGNVAIFQLLIDAGANINATTSYLDTPLHIAAQEGNYEVAELLINLGADVYAQNEAGTTPRNLASWWGRTKVVQLLDNIDKNHSESTMKSISKNSESSETAKVEDESPQDQAEVEEESATSSSVPGTAPPESQEGKPNDEGFIGSIFKWLRSPPISGEKEAEIIPFDPPLNKGKVVEVHYVAMPGQGAFEEVGDH